ncbi:DinB family protein [Paenibacillus medicaginis]|uniref:DinB family protein n=1 Tax=Paenibacillus medicaginis TaxID=1470560 RepID=A0ABV5C0F9_9BACL
MKNKQSNMLSSTSTEVAQDLQVIADGLLEDIFKIIRRMPAEALNWTPPQMNNSPYVLVNHLLGSAGYWIGDVVGGIASDRVRANEFGAQGTHEDLEKLLADTRDKINLTLERVSEKDLLPRPIDLSHGVLCWGDVPPEGRTSVWVIVHDLCHIAYTYGQLERISKLWDIQHA